MNLPIVSTGSGSVVEGRGAVPLELCGMDRECSCPGHQARDEVGVLGDIDLDAEVGAAEGGLGEGRRGWYTSRLGFEWTDLHRDVNVVNVPTAVYPLVVRNLSPVPYPEEIDPNGSDLDTSSVEVSIDDDDLAAREAETAAVTSRL